METISRRKFTSVVAGSAVAVLATGALASPADGNQDMITIQMTRADAESLLRSLVVPGCPIDPGVETRIVAQMTDRESPYSAYMTQREKAEWLGAYGRNAPINPKVTLQ